MRINDLLTESQQQLDEGPLGNVGRAIGKGVGGLAKGVGAVAGGVAGVGTALKKGYQTGKAAVAGTPDPNAEPEEPATTAADANAQGPKGTAPAQAQSGAAGTAMAKSAQAVAGAPNADKAGQTLYAQVKASVNQLDKKGKQRIMQLLQKSLAAPAAAAAPAQSTADKISAAQQAAAPAAQSAPAAQQPAVKRNPNNPDDLGFGFDVDTGLPLKSQAEKNANIAKADAAEKAAAKPKKKPAAPSQATIDADRARLMGTTTDSIVRTGNNLSETLARKVEEQKRKMFESGLTNGTVSVFKK
jgi:hypothetical protein